MNRRSALAALAGGALVSAARAEYGVIAHGAWPANWPKELEPLRAQARTFVGPKAPNRHYAIFFNEREEFEAAWPHLLKVKSKGGGLHLVRGPNFFLGGSRVGVVVHAPPLDSDVGAVVPNPPARGKGIRGAVEATYFELVADGTIVDLNRVQLPADTMITDERFKGRGK